jgi:integrase
MWSPEQTSIYIAKAGKLGWHSVAAMIQVFDCIGQSPIDVIGMKARAYNGRSLSVTREKTGVSDAPIPLWPDVIALLDEYLATRPKLHPDAHLFVNEKTGRPWVVSTLAKVHSAIRAASGLPKELQLQDFRRTAQTEAGAAGATADEIRALARHSTRTAALHYVHPDARYVEAAQQKRQQNRNARAASVLPNVGMKENKKLE